MEENYATMHSYPVHMHTQSRAMYGEEERSLFLGDLSNFCEDRDIFEFFHHCGEIESIRLMRSKATNKCLGYGFITFFDINALPIAMRLYGTVFMGRKIKIGMANPRKASPVSAKIAALLREFDGSRVTPKDNSNNNAQVHFSFITQNVSLAVTESVVREIFIKFGEIEDVTIKKSTIDPMSQSQSGYGFIHFALTEEGMRAAIDASMEIKQVLIADVLYDSCLTRAMEGVLRTSPSLRSYLAMMQARKASPPPRLPVQIPSYVRGVVPSGRSTQFTSPPQHHFVEMTHPVAPKVMYDENLSTYGGPTSDNYGAHSTGFHQPSSWTTSDSASHYQSFIPEDSPSSILGKGSQSSSRKSSGSIPFLSGMSNSQPSSRNSSVYYPSTNNSNNNSFYSMMQDNYQHSQNLNNW